MIVAVEGQGSLQDQVIDRVEAVLDLDVRPHLALHNGNVEVDRLTDDGVLSLRLTGWCSHCPGAQLEIGSFVADAVRAGVPAVTRVQAVSSVSDALMAQARGMLSHHAHRSDKPRRTVLSGPSVESGRWVR